MYVLGIESTCDETACSIVHAGKEILANVVSSQIDLHEQYGGVVPELACRRHIDVILPVLKECLAQARLQLTQLDLIAVANGPGLIGALLIGLNTAKSLSLALGKPLIGVNHVEAHLYAALMSHSEEVQFPCLGIVLSGGHTTLLKIEALGRYALLSETVDDAIGEAFDKVAKILDLPYPGGPQIEALALQGDAHRFPLKPGKVKGSPLHFSFSGLKTGVLYAVKGQNGAQTNSFNQQDKADLAASFQRVALNDILEKTVIAAHQHNCSTLVFGGGVTHNNALRRLFGEKAPHLNCLWPGPGLSLDNGAMIAGLGYHKFLEKGGDPLDLDALTRIAF